MQQHGKLTDWNDDKGFGFITPASGGPRVFVHISSFPRGPRRPRVDERISYAVTRDKQNRLRAENVAFRHRSRRLTPRARGIALALVLSVLFFALLGAAIHFEYAPPALLGAYALASMLLFGVYGLDKAAARKGRWRTEEATLHLFAVAGGWPGGLVAQRVFRHKTQKQPFQAIFWGAVLVNCAALGWLLFSPEAAGLRDTLGFD